MLEGKAFDEAIGLLTDAIAPAEVASLRAQMGFIDENSVTIREFEAALRLRKCRTASSLRLFCRTAADRPA